MRALRHLLTARTCRTCAGVAVTGPRAEAVRPIPTHRCLSPSSTGSPSHPKIVVSLAAPADNHRDVTGHEDQLVELDVALTPLLTDRLTRVVVAPPRPSGFSRRRKVILATSSAKLSTFTSNPGSPRSQRIRR
jgi:hypothetical protein